MKAIGNKIHARRILDSHKVGSFEVVGMCDDMNPLFEVLSAGELVKGIKAGDMIVCGQYQGEEVGKNEYIFKESDVLAIAEQ